MASPIDELVEFHGTGAVIEKARSALARIIEIPEIEQKIREGNALHQEKLLIMEAANGKDFSYNFRQHRIDVSDAEIEFMDINGHKYVPSMETGLAHEIEHSRDPQLNSELRIAVLEHMDQLMEKASMDGFMEALSQYEARLRATRDESKLRSIFSDMYDTHLEKKMLDALTQDPQITAYHSRFEEPAIALENHVAQQLGHPIRMNNYIESARSLGAQFKERFLDNVIAGMKESRAERLAKTSPADPSTIRPDAPPPGDTWDKQ